MINIIIVSINPIAISIGKLSIYWYALTYLITIILGFQYLIYFCCIKKKIMNQRKLHNLLFWIILGMILGARIGYIVFYNLKYFLQDIINIFKIWQGGMSFHGGLIGIIFTVILYSYKYKVKIFVLFDVIAIITPIGLFCGRIANFVNGELFGRSTNIYWAMIFTDADLIPRHPSQLYEAFCEGSILFILLFFLSSIVFINKRPGIISGIFLLTYGFLRTIVEYFREPDIQIGFLSWGLTMGQILSIPMIIIGIICIISRYKTLSLDCAKKH